MNREAQSAVCKYALLPLSRSETIASASQAAPNVPNVFPQDCPNKEMMTAHKGCTPMPISRGAPTATGTPNPVMPCKKLSKTHPIAKSYKS